MPMVDTMDPLKIYENRIPGHGIDESTKKPYFSNRPSKGQGFRCVAHTPLESADRLGRLRPQREFAMIICKVGPVAFRKPCLNSRILGSFAEYRPVPLG